jgi:hypothetical protein
MPWNGNWAPAVVLDSASQATEGTLGSLQPHEPLTLALLLCFLTAETEGVGQEVKSPEVS